MIYRGYEAGSISAHRAEAWKRIARENIPVGNRVLKGTWALKLKRFPDEIPSKYKARLCVKGDL